jgi:hypothetical protein
VRVRVCELWEIARSLFSKIRDAVTCTNFTLTAETA